jgi:superfamily II DNA or RNA helicase
MEWAAPDGSIHSATFDDRLDSARTSQRLRTALSLDGEWLPSVLRSAHARLTEVRREQPDAGGLVIATDQEHARGIAELLRTRFKTSARVVTSDDPLASAGIAEFAAGSDPWLVAVRMVSEGVDIPRLRVGVYATTTSTELFFRQAVGRLVRWTRGVPRQRAWLFIPDDPRLRRHAAGVAEQRRHSLRKRDVEPRVEGEQERELGYEEQMSLFAALSAVATEASDPSGDFGDEPELDDGPNDEIELTLAPPPPLAGRADEGGATATLTRKEEKGALRDANAKVARELVRRTRMTHGQVNAELNRLSRVRKVSEATIDELERRLVAADRWLAKT